MSNDGRRCAFGSSEIENEYENENENEGRCGNAALTSLHRQHHFTKLFKISQT